VFRAAHSKLELRVTNPASVKIPVPFPPVKPSGVTMTALYGGTYNRTTPVTVLLACSPDLVGTLLRVSLAKRERDVVTVYKSLRPKQNSGSHGVPIPDGAAFDILELQTPDSAWADGVLRATVYNSATSVPLVER
jgi:hypothetical protein